MVLGEEPGSNSFLMTSVAITLIVYCHRRSHFYSEESEVAGGAMAAGDNNDRGEES